jgi:hypothetical protein
MNIMMKKYLPISLQKEINGYLFYALPYCVLKSNTGLSDWILENYINCYCFDLPAFSYIDAATYQTKTAINEAMDIDTISYDILELSWDISQLIINSINSERYIVIFLDEFYIEGREAYQNRYFLHEMLIFGYDDDNFYYIAFDKKQRFAIQNFPKTNINDAYWKGKEIATNFNLWQEYNHSIILLKNRELPEYRFSRERFIDKVKCYSKGIPGCHNYLIMKTKGETFFYGVNNTLMFESYILSGRENSFNFYTAIHSWYEHKRGLLSRFKYVRNKFVQEGYLDSIIEKYSGLVDDANILRMLSLKSQSFDNGRNFKKIIEKSLQIYECESKILEDVY